MNSNEAFKTIKLINKLLISKQLTIKFIKQIVKSLSNKDCIKS